jgi:hypothetical protein
LQSRVELGVELEHRRTIGQLQHRGAGRGRRRHSHFVVLREHHLPIGLGAAQQEIPVGGIVLDDFFQRSGRRFDVLAQPMPVKQLLDDVAVFLVDEVAALVRAGHLHRITAAVHDKSAAVLADLDALLDDQPLEERLVLRAIPELNLDSLTGHEAVGIADRERGFGGFAVFDLNACRRDPVQFAVEGN